MGAKVTTRSAEPGEEVPVVPVDTSAHPQLRRERGACGICSGRM